jgi:hypothetical protein
MHTDAECLSEFLLRQADEAPKCRNIARPELARDDPLALHSRERALELFPFQLFSIPHAAPPLITTQRFQTLRR